MTLDLILAPDLPKEGQLIGSCEIYTVVLIGISFLCTTNFISLGKPCVENSFAGISDDKHLLVLMS